MILTVSKEVRAFVYKRDKGRCQECGRTELVCYDRTAEVTEDDVWPVDKVILRCERCILTERFSAEWVEEYYRDGLDEGYKQDNELAE